MPKCSKRPQLALGDSARSSTMPELIPLAAFFVYDFAEDVRRANAGVGFKGGKRTGSTWHHRQDGKTMMLAPSDLHNKVSRAGGQAAYKSAAGDPTAYPKGKK